MEERGEKVPSTLLPLRRKVVEKLEVLQIHCCEHWRFLGVQDMQEEGGEAPCTRLFKGSKKHSDWEPLAYFTLFSQCLYLARYIKTSPSLLFPK